MKAHFVWDVEERARLLELLDDRIELSFGEVAPADTQILVEGRPSEAMLDACPKMHTLLIPYAGLPKDTRTLLTQRPQIAVHNIHHNAGPASELAIALLLAAGKHLVPLDQRLRKGDWMPRYEGHPALFLEGKRALVLGYGAIGQRVARVLCAFGMDVHALRRRGDGNDAAITLHGPEALTELLPLSQVILVSLPLTGDTLGMIGKAELARLPAETLLVNVARAAIVDEQALFEALESKRLAAAGIDVWYHYPSADMRNCTLPSKFPFHQLDNVVMSPHRGGAYRHPENELLRLAELAKSLNAAARGEAMPNSVNLEAGY